MANYRVTWGFEGMQQSFGRSQSFSCGWTESWYRVSNDNLDGVLLEAIQDLPAQGASPGSWIRHRRGFLHAAYVIKWARVVDADRPGVFKAAFVPNAPAGMSGQPNGGGRIVFAPEIEGTNAQVNCAVLVDFMRLPGAAPDKSHHRRSLLRGISRNLINGNVLKTEGPDYLALLRFCDYVARGMAPRTNVPATDPIWSIQYQNPAQTWQPITALTIDAANNRHITLTSPLPIAARDRIIKIRGVDQPDQVDRDWRVRLDAPAGGPYLLGTKGKGVSGVFNGTGVANLTTYLYGPCDQYTVIGLRNKKTGSDPITSPAGRR